MAPAWPPIDARTRKVAQRLVWFGPPEQARADPARYLACAFRHARSADIAIIGEHLTDDDLRHALRRAPRGIIDPRSRADWHVMLDAGPPPVLPTRALGRSP